MAARKKAAGKKADTAQADGALVDHETEKEEPPPLSVETVDGLLSLRGHLETRVPGGLLWPLQKLPSMDQHMSDMGSAGDAVDSLAVRHAMSTAKLAELQNFLLGDAYAMTYLVCRHRELVPEVHMAMCYASAGQAQRLAWLLTQSGFGGYIIEQYREELRFRGIELGEPGAIAKLDLALNWVQFRDPRGVFKSSAITHGGAVTEATLDPNTTAFITCAKDDKAWELVLQIGETVTSGIYRDLFPHRVPVAARDTSKEKIRMGGRTISHRQVTIQGSGYLSKEVGGHGDRFRTDDLVVRGPRGNDSPEALVGVRKHLSGMQGFHMLTRRVRKIHTGTMAVEGDDYHWLTENTRRRLCMTFHHPIEVHETPPANIFVRGTPTMPTFLPVERIDEIQAGVVTSELEVEGVEDWLCDYMLVPAARGGALFAEEVVNDQDRAWLGPYASPRTMPMPAAPPPIASGVVTARFLIARIKRDEKGAPQDKNGKALDVKLDGWRGSVAIESFDPWTDLDRILTVNPTWTSGARLWAVTATAVDPDGVRYQLETRFGDDGVFGWAVALDEMAKTYLPRRIGLETRALNDPVIVNAMRTDERLRAHRGRIIGVDLQSSTQESRIRAAVAEPLRAYRWMLLPVKVEGAADAKDFGAVATRRELLKYRSGADTPWPILDSLAMTGALLERVQTREQRAEARRSQLDSDARYRQSIGSLGVPSAA